MNTIQCGGDTDTVGSIVGSLIGILGAVFLIAGIFYRKEVLIS